MQFNLEVFADALERHRFYKVFLCDSEGLVMIL